MTRIPQSFVSATITHIVLAAAVLAVAASAAWAGPPPEGFSEIIEVRFAPGTDVDPPTGALPPPLAAQVASMRRLVTLSAGQLELLQSADPALPDMKLWFEIHLGVGADPGDFLAQLQAGKNVDVAEFRPFVSEPQPQPCPVTSGAMGSQGYLGPAPGGIAAEFSWDQPGGKGSWTNVDDDVKRITIYDVERYWRQTHEDLDRANPDDVTPLVPPGDSPSPFLDTEGTEGTEHGTNVIGMLIATRDPVDDPRGITGISYEADIALVPRVTANLGNNPTHAITRATADASPGDVILIEAQAVVVCGKGEGPLESETAFFNATQIAVANGITVVAAAGNGNVDLDQTDCNDLFDRGKRDSGAIIVGAGASSTSTANLQHLNKPAASCWGKRVDVQGWGDSVSTTGHINDPDNPDYNCVDAEDPFNPDRFYTIDFSGTSAAAAMVAGAVANLQSIALQNFGTPLLPFQIRELLRETGTPQQGESCDTGTGCARKIGPRPDLEHAINRLLNAEKLDLFILVDTSGSFWDDLPLFKDQAPDIISNIQSMHPNVQFGLGRFDDYPIPPFGGPGDVAYARLMDVKLAEGETNATHNAKVLEAIKDPNLKTNDGNDEPESQLVALFQAASGAGQEDLNPPEANIPPGRNVTFRNGATKLFLLWTDAPFHRKNDPGDTIPYPGPTFVEVVEAIEALDPPQVIGISSGEDGMADLKEIAAATGAFAPDAGVDCDADGSIDIPAGEPLVCQIADTGEGIAEAIVSIVEAAVEAATPVAVCRDAATPTDPGVCSAVVSVDDGSSDPDGGPVVITQSPPGPYPVGASAVTLKVSDDTGLSDSCIASVNVFDEELPVPSCNAPVVTPPDAPIAITATATDTCGVADVVVSDPDCFKFTKKGKRIDEIGVCKKIGLSGDTITINNTGGVDTHISWKVTATDESGNVNASDCEIVIQNPGARP